MTMTLFTVATFFRFVFESYNFLLFSLFFNSSNDSSSFNNWSTNYSFVTTYKNNFVKSDFCASFSVNFLNVDCLTYFNFNLFSTSFDDCVCAHDAPPIKFLVEVSLCEDSPGIVRLGLLDNDFRAVAQDVHLVNVTILAP
ncbi:ribosomal protein L21 [Streptococcus dysgalactiae subsp. equisimilis RE378]|nr:ribosomal protein L21 [Streptococcus dysgalactiae subsp. equisimilis GGS_124]BAM60907.1 ribosomal protein L21 [Streptococcus dysgalactiae subsp. equisimilis RE378]